MARLPYLDAKDLAENDQEILKRPINLHRALAHSPEGAKAFGKVGSWIRFGSRLDPKLRELAILQVGWLSKSPYEWSHHVKIGKDFGLSDAEIEAVKLEAAGEKTQLPKLYRLALQAAREMATNGEMAETTYNQLSEDLTNELMVDLVIVIAFYCGVVRLLASLGVDVEPSYQPHLDAHPLPK